MMGFLLFNPAPQAHRDDRPGRRLAGQVLPPPPAACTRIEVVEINPPRDRLRDAFHVPPDSARFRVLQATARASCATADTASTCCWSTASTATACRRA
jgi:spermidine synthase